MPEDGSLLEKDGLGTITEADIDKSKVIITKHAILRFLEHRKSLGSREIKDYMEAAEKIRKLFLKAKHQKAISDDLRKEKEAKYKEKAFYFRNWRWFFVVIRKETDPETFMLKTVTLIGNWKITNSSEKQFPEIIIHCPS